jgi:hypothetical protein
MNAICSVARVSLVCGSLLLVAECKSPPTVITQSTTTTETTAVSRGHRVITPPTTVVYTPTVRTVAVYD